MMTSDEAIERLKRHAGFVEAEAEPADMHALLHAAKVGKKLGDVEAATGDVVRCLDAINRVVNPHDVETTQVPRQFPRVFIGAVSQITYDLLGAAIDPALRDQQSRLLKAAWTIQAAWNAVAAGEVLNIAEHVQRESEVKQKGH